MESLGFDFVRLEETRLGGGDGGGGTGRGGGGDGRRGVRDGRGDGVRGGERGGRQAAVEERAAAGFPRGSGAGRAAEEGRVVRREVPRGMEAAPRQRRGPRPGGRGRGPGVRLHGRRAQQRGGRQQLPRAGRRAQRGREPVRRVGGRGAL